MTWLLFMDESGHDHKNAPAEVRGGFALHVSKVWPFVQAWQDLEMRTYGVRLAEFKREVKGHRLLDKDRFKWAAQMDELSDEERRHGVRRFLTRSLEKLPLTRSDFTSYGQACLAMSRGIFQLLRTFDGVAFASVVPKGTRPPPDYGFEHFLRKDHVFLLERFFYFLEARGEHGLLVMDETEKTEDRRFVARLHDYFTRTQTGRDRTERIVPSPLFVSSEMSVGVQAADVLIYCINWGYRPESWGFDGPTRPEIAQAYARSLSSLQFSGQGSRRGESFLTKGIFFLPDVYQARGADNKKGGKADAATSQG